MRALLILSVALFGSVYCRSGDGDCRTPRKGPGDCINVRKCSVLLKTLAVKPVSVETAQYLRDSACGFDGSTPKVCCPSTGSLITTEADISGHPNRGLLPDFPNCGLSVFHERVVGGMDAKVGAFPWIALLGYRSNKGVERWMCGGAAINEKYVITAAHCINVPNYKLVRVRLGEHTISNEGPDCAKDTNHCAPAAVDHTLEQIRVHPQYDTPRFRHDVALLRLRNKIQFNNFVRPICMPIPLADSDMMSLNPQLEALFVAGWGKTESGRGSDILQMLKVPPITLAECQKVFKNQIQLAAGQMCAGGQKGEDSCSGDSGGPLMLLQGSPVGSRFYLAAVVSLGPTACGTGGQPGIYTRIGGYLGWILDTIKP